MKTKATMVAAAFLLLGMAIFSFNCGGGGGSSSVERLAFYTSTTGPGDLSSWTEVSGSGLSGLEAADAICNTRAAAAGLDGTFVAWLSDQSHDAYCRVHGMSGKKSANCGQGTLPAEAGPWFRTDGTPFSGRIDQLTDSYVQYSPMRYDEFGIRSSLNLGFWTGTDSFGAWSMDNCSDWSDSTSTVLNVFLGTNHGVGGGWTAGNMTQNCSSPNNLLCLELGTNNTSPDPQAAGKTVFTTSVNGSGNLGSWPEAGGNTGLAAGDAICRSLAATAGLSNAGSFRAWLSDSGSNAVGRLNSDGPWVRVDGMMVAESKSALVNSWLLTAINVDENGDYDEGDPNWTGTLSTGNKSIYHCSDWTSSSGSDLAFYGYSGRADGSGWSTFNTIPCSINLPFYCFED